MTAERINKNESMKEKTSFGLHKCHKCKKVRDCDRVNGRREFFCSDQCADIHAVEHGIKFSVTNKKQIEQN
jgi:hypothetical protein